MSFDLVLLSPCCSPSHIFSQLQFTVMFFSSSYSPQSVLCYSLLYHTGLPRPVAYSVSNCHFSLKAPSRRVIPCTGIQTLAIIYTRTSCRTRLRPDQWQVHRDLLGHDGVLMTSRKLGWMPRCIYYCLRHLLHPDLQSSVNTQWKELERTQTR
ncbi:hypothetical protein K466DRAFT_656871 [Polyporus arcularius HHB13444]|uniref:Uncharacterized protein n=1 Tax=Polyporus arcularius HHB13444 TaxID=1314778 RepID=A0A5C3NQ96_9APHY|nr:hypothetical protein K466DRAFT_656871 [Polyporus arcularius HHB13444]